MRKLRRHRAVPLCRRRGNGASDVRRTWHPTHGHPTIRDMHPLQLAIPHLAHGHSDRQYFRVADWDRPNPPYSTALTAI